MKSEIIHIHEFLFKAFTFTVATALVFAGIACSTGSLLTAAGGFNATLLFALSR